MEWGSLNHDKILKSSRRDSNNKSSGIGLSIVKKIIDFIKEFGWRVRKKRDYILQYLKLMEEANLNYIDELSGDDLDFYTNIIFIIKENSLMK
jgi:hemerythrin-like domain-containing protein